ncbi:hypothetical protein ACFLQL_01195 [Verrucomicrobiota bacterium]
MKIISFYICLFSIIAPLLAETNVNYLSADEIMQGLRSHSEVNSYPELMVRQKWLNSLYPKQTMLTNMAERIKLTEELVLILNFENSNNEDKCAAAYFIGLFRLKEGIKGLINNFLLWNKAALEPDLIPAEGTKPAQKALIKIGEAAMPEVKELIESTTDSYTLKYGAQVILFIKGQKDGSEFLKQAIAGQTDSKKKENLKAVLASEYFTDPKYQASGPQTQKEILEAQVTLKPEALKVSPGILTAHIRLPDGFPAGGITSATCDGAPSERMMPNKNGTEMIIKFRRKDIEAALAQTGESIDTNFVVRGIWQGSAGTSLFQGTASITKIVGTNLSRSEREEKEKKKEK